MQELLVSWLLNLATGTPFAENQKECGPFIKMYNPIVYFFCLRTNQFDDSDELFQCVSSLG